jgi:hypothetical protein
VTTPGARATVGTIVVNAPADAKVTIRDQDIGYGQSRRDSLAPGTYSVRAELPAIEGCNESRQVTTVNVVAGRVHTVTLAPKLCGTLELRAVGRDSRNQNVARELWYTLTPEGANEGTDLLLPAAGITRVVPVGKYTLRVKMRTCANYEEENPPLEIFAGEKTTRVSIALLCG